MRFARPVALLPVLVFLAALIYFDSFKLVGVRADPGRDRRPARWPRAAAIWLNGFMLDRARISFEPYLALRVALARGIAEGARCSCT